MLRKITQEEEEYYFTFRYGMEADLLKEGRTTHSGFKLPIRITETSVSSMKPHSAEGGAFIIIDGVDVPSTSFH